MSKVALIGGGDLTQQLLHYIEEFDDNVSVAGFFDDFIPVGEKRFGISCLGSVSSILVLYKNQKFDSLLLGVGYNNLRSRQLIFDAIQGTVPFYTFIHPAAIIDSSASIGEGCIIGPGVIVEQRVNLGANVMLYGGVNISHDSSIGAHTFMAPAVAVAGFSHIGARCFVGIHSTITEKVSVSDDVVIGAASLVLRDILEPGLYLGIPVQKKK